MILETIDKCDSCAYVCICVSIFYYKRLAENNESALVKIITQDISAFSIQKSLQVIKRAHIKIVVRAVTLTFSRAGKKFVVIVVFLSKLDHRPLFNDIR